MGTLSRHKGSSTCGEAGPLFPPLHVNDTGKAVLRAPPRNKMALFEQFTVPCNHYLPPNKGAASRSASNQHGTNDFLNTCTQSAMIAALAPATANNELGGIGKSSYGSNPQSLSTCSAVVNMDESQRFQVQEPKKDTCSLVVSKVGMVSGKGWSLNEKISKDNSQDMNVAKGLYLSPHVVDKGEGCDQAFGSMLEGFHKWDKDLIPAGSQMFGSKTDGIIRPMENVHGKAPNKLKSNEQYTVGSAVNALEKAGASIGTIVPISPRDKIKSSLVPPLPAIIKPKDVIHAVGEQLFWKARKAILRQQEVFSNQLFELHKLIEVQKLLAKMPSTLTDEHLLSGMTSDRIHGDFYPVKGTSKKQAKFNKGAVQAPAFSHGCEGETHESRPPHPQRVLPLEENEGQVVGAVSQTRRYSDSSYWPQAMIHAPFSQARLSSSSDSLSAWGYPMGSLNRSFLYPPGAGPSGSGFGGAYVVGANPPMAPFTFPCYTPMPEQQGPIFYSGNQWSTPMYHNPFLAPMANEWFAMNHSGQVPLTCGSENLGLTNSVPSINMKAEASSQTVQPAVASLSRGQHFGKSIRTKLVATKLLGSVATASASPAPDDLSGKPGPRSLGQHTPNANPWFMPKVWGAFGGETAAAIEVRRLLKYTKEGAQMPLCSREIGDRSLEKNALNLFPLEPSSTSGTGEVLRRGGGNEGRVIKAIPRSALAASESAAGILLSIQRERQL